MRSRLLGTRGPAASVAKDTARLRRAARRIHACRGVVRPGPALPRNGALEDNVGFPYAAHPIPMHFPTHEQKQALLEQVLRLADQRLDARAAKEARTFIARYYEQVDAEDLATRAPEDLYGAAIAHLA